MSSTRPKPLQLSRRERQLLDALYLRGEATAVELTGDIEDAPTSTTVRGLLRILERKGLIEHEQIGPRFLYRPAMAKQEAAASTLAHVVRTFFGGSPSQAMVALLGSQKRLPEAEIQAIESAIRDLRLGAKKK